MKAATKLNTNSNNESSKMETCSLFLTLLFHLNIVNPNCIDKSFIDSIVPNNQFGMKGGINK